MEEKIKKLLELGWVEYEDNEEDYPEIYYKKTIGIRNCVIDFNEDDMDLSVRDGLYQNYNLKRNISFEWLAQFEELISDKLIETAKPTRLTAQEAKELTKSCEPAVIENILELIKDASLKHSYSIDIYPMSKSIIDSLENLGYLVTKNHQKRTDSISWG